MKSTILILGIMLLSLASALTFYGGYTYEIDMSNDFNSLNNSTINITGNSSSLEGLNYSINGTTLILTFDTGYVPDNFTLTISGDGKIIEVENNKIQKSESGGRWTKKTTSIEIKNETEVDFNNNETELIENIPEEKKSIIIFWIVLSLIVVFGIVVVFFIINFINKE